MTTLTQKKNYTTPRCVFVSLEEETSLLSGSIISVDEHTEAQKENAYFGIYQTDYNEITGNSPIWGNSFD